MKLASLKITHAELSPCFCVPPGEGHHERHHVQPAADQQREDPAELGAAVHALVPRGQRAQLHHQLGRRPGVQRRPAPLQVSGGVTRKSR